MESQEQDADQCNTTDPTHSDGHAFLLLLQKQTKVGPHSQHKTQEFAWKHLETTSSSGYKPTCFVYLWCSHEVSYICSQTAQKG